MATEDAGSNPMAAVYTVHVTGIKRTREQLAKLDGVVRSIRSGHYSNTSSMTQSSQLGLSDVAVTKLDRLEGHIQEVTQKALIQGMDMGKNLQADYLRAAVTPKGLSGKPKGRKSPGREVTGRLINALRRSVEAVKGAESTSFTGWHGWGLKETGGREGYFGYQELGTSKIEPANSIGQAIVPVTEFLKRELGRLKK